MKAKELESKASEVSLTLTPGSPWTPGDPDSPRSPYKQTSIQVSLQPHISAKNRQNSNPHPLSRLAHSPLPSYLLSRGTQVPNTSRGTLWALKEEEKPF